MIRAEQIPDEVVEPLAIAIAGGSLRWTHALEVHRKTWRKEARAAAAAMLNAWPDSILMPAELILPLPSEEGDA